MRAMANSTSTRIISTAAVANPRAISAGCGDRTNSKVASGSDTIGPSIGLTFSVEVNPAVSSTGAVSPTPRATPRITDVVRPDRAVGSTTCHTVRHCGAPERRRRLSEVARARAAGPRRPTG